VSSTPDSARASQGYEVGAIANYRCQVGENPLWNVRDGRIYWEDIDTGRLFRANPKTREHECFYQGEVLGGFTFQGDGRLLLFEADRIAELGIDGGERRVLVQGIDPEMVRFNDVIADPEGRVFAGTIGRTSESGGLYRIDLDGSVHCVWKGTGCANGSGFTPDLSAFYWTCSTTRQIYVAKYDRASGVLSERRLFWAAEGALGSPDGLTVDASGGVWSAFWGDSCVVRFDAEARVVERIELPVPKVSSLTFGGPELDTLYITTAGGHSEDTHADGTLYAVRTRARGRPEFLSRIVF
jgi:D-xylonolactonase